MNFRLPCPSHFPSWFMETYFIFNYSEVITNYNTVSNLRLPDPRPLEYNTSGSVTALSVPFPGTEFKELWLKIK